MIELIGLLLAIATFAFVVYPLFTHIAEPARASGNERLQELQSRKNTAYSMLKEVEFDHHAGLLSDDDRKELETDYRKKALSLLAGIDSERNLSGEMEVDLERQVQGLRRGKAKVGTAAASSEIEKQVRRLRHGAMPQASADGDIERQVKALRGSQTPGGFCPQCGAVTQGEDNFCRRCGRKLD